MALVFAFVTCFVILKENKGVLVVYLIELNIDYLDPNLLVAGYY